MDKFPEAFERFEETVDTERIYSFMQLKLAFRYWQGHALTENQEKALKVEAECVGIPVLGKYERPEYHYRRVERQPRSYRRETFTVWGRSRTVIRDLRTGRFMREFVRGDYPDE